VDPDPVIFAILLYSILCVVTPNPLLIFGLGQDPAPRLLLITPDPDSDPGPGPGSRSCYSSLTSNASQTISFNTICLLL
jgi:hypothetical protein